MQLAVSEAKPRLSELIAAAERGERVVITRRGSPRWNWLPAPNGSAAAASISSGLRRRGGAWGSWTIRPMSRGK